jgi:rhodanese-related sulfurtransferase
MKARVMGVFAFLFFALAASGANAIGPDDVLRITPKELKAKMERGERVFILDVRSKGSYNSSQVKIKGAVRIVLEELADRASEIPFGREVIAYCT